MDEAKGTEVLVKYPGLRTKRNEGEVNERWST
jgi:hypothetical protein